MELKPHPSRNMLIFYFYFIFELKFHHKEVLKTLMTTVITSAGTVHTYYVGNTYVYVIIMITYRYGILYISSIKKTPLCENVFIGFNKKDTFVWKCVYTKARTLDTYVSLQCIKMLSCLWTKFQKLHWFIWILHTYILCVYPTTTAIDTNTYKV